jgi:hypothetical protein
MGFSIFVELALLFGNGIHVLLIAAFASKADRGRPQACKAHWHGFRPPPGRRVDA